MPNFFIDRPIFAWVIAIIIMLAGARDPQIAGSAISDYCTASSDDLATIPALMPNSTGYCYAGYRTEYERYR